MKQKEMFSWNSLAFSVIQWMLAIWSLVPLPFLNPAWTSGSSRFRYCWSLSSVQFSHSVISNSLWPYELQHARPPCPSPTPGVHSNSRSSSRWCHPAISSSVGPFSSCPQSLPASGSFPMSQLLAWGGQSIGVSAVASVLLMNTQDWSPLGWTGWISLQSKGLSRIFSKPQFKSINSLALSFLLSPTLTSMHDYWKTIALTEWTFVGKVMSLLLNMLSWLVITFLLRSKCLNFMATVTICSDFGAPPNKVSHCFPIYLPWSDGTGCYDLSFLNVEL